MESHASERTPTNASALYKRRNGQENDVPPSPVSHTGNARSRRPLALIGGAHDAAAAQPQQTSDVSADERATLLDELAAFAAAQPKALRLDEAPSARRAPPAHALASFCAQPLRERRAPPARALASICAQPPREIVVEISDDDPKPSARTARLRKRVLDKGGDPDEDVFASAPSKAGTRFKNRVGPDAYAPHERPSQAGGTAYPKNPELWVHYKHDDQIDHDREALQKINMGNRRSGLDALIDGANKVGRLFFNKFEIMVEQEVCSPMRLGALTRSSTTTLSGRVLRIDRNERKRREGRHVAVYREMAKVLRDDLGVVAGESGRVVGPLSPFAVAGDYHGYDDHVTKMTEASSLFHKGLIQAATLGRIDPFIEEGVNCNFARRTIESAKYGGIANDKRGNFGSNARGEAPLVQAQVDPRQQRFGMRAWLTAEPLSDTAWGFVGVSGAKTNAAAEASGGMNIAFFSLAGYDAAALSLKGIASEYTRPITPVAAGVEAFQDTLALCSEKQPHLLAVYEAMWRLGVAEEPNTARNPWKCLKRPVDAMSKWARAESALSRAFSVGLGDGKKLLCTTKDFENIRAWEPHWSCTRELLDHAGVDCLSELVHVSGDASGGVNVSSGRDWSGGDRYVPRDTAEPDGHGGFKRKPKKRLRGTGNGPVMFTCHRCKHEWWPETFSTVSGRYEGWAWCKCDTLVKPPA